MPVESVSVERIEHHPQRWRCWIRAAIATFLLCVSIPAMAQSSDEDAAAASVLRRQGDERRDASELATALTLYQEAARLAPEDLASQYKLAWTAAELGERKIGLAAIEACVRISRELTDDAELKKLHRRLEAMVAADGTASAGQPHDRATEGDAGSGGRGGAREQAPAEIALAIRQAELVLADARRETDPDRQKTLASEARKALRPILVDPRLEDARGWKLAGMVAIYTEDNHLAAYAYEGIDRLVEGWASDDAMLTLMAELQRMDIAAEVATIPDARLELIEQLLPEAHRSVATGRDLFRLGSAYQKGNGIPQDDAEAMRWYRNAADAGEASAMNSLGVMYDNGRGVPQSDTEAVKWYRKAVDAGNARAMFNLGSMYENGEGVPLNYTEAVKWYRMAGDAGDSWAMNNLGIMYKSGRGVPSNDTEALKWYRQAAGAGNARAMCNLGKMYTDGRGVQQNHTEAVKWYRKAADAGDALSMYRLGVAYTNGEGVPQSDTEAVKWYRKAADAGEASAMFNLGFMYDNGRGVPQNDTEAVRWYRKAAREGHTRAQQVLRNKGLSW